MQAAATPVTDDRLDALEAALGREREALLGHDVEALMAATQAKLDTLRALESDPPPGEVRERLVALYEFNTANGALLARRRREVNWALKALGRTEARTGYDALGRVAPSMQNRSLGAA
jgi:hypothetical protein